MFLLLIKVFFTRFALTNTPACSVTAICDITPIKAGVTFMYTCLRQVHSLSFPACMGMCPCPLYSYVKAVSAVSNGISSWSQNHLMAKVATLIFSCCLKVRFYRFCLSRAIAFLLLAHTYLLFLCSWPVSEVDRVATLEAWVPLAGCQQAYDCSNDGTSDRELPASVCAKWKWWWRRHVCTYTS